MPITVKHPVRRMSQAEFGDLAYEVMRAVFAIRDELGRFFDEKIYKRELAHRFPGVQLEVPVEARHGTFAKTCFLDALVKDGGLFEFKTVETLTVRHEAQLLHYLLLTELEHAKLVNLRTETIEQRFVNTTLRHQDRMRFQVMTDGWDRKTDGAGRFQDVLLELLGDWGTGLDLSLYDDALAHFLGGESAGLKDVEIRAGDHGLGHQTMRMAASGVAFKLTALQKDLHLFESHASRLLAHTNLEAMLWANITRGVVSLRVIGQKDGGQKNQEGRRGI